MRAGAPKAAFFLTVFGIFMLVVAMTASARTRAYLSPGTGGQKTSFVLRFRNPDQTGSSGLLHSREVLSVAGPNHDHACVSRVSMQLPATRKGAHVRMTLKPGRLGGEWCAGRFEGRVTEFQTIVCPPTRACPQLMVAPRTIFRFSFRVRQSQTSTGGGPAFAGLQSATTCSLPVVDPLPHQQVGRVYMLNWAAASDPGTPSSGIVYDVYYASTSGGENYSSPSWTSEPGATSFTTPSVGPGPAFFVVRARDQAGREDQNTVQRAGADDCG